MFPCIAQYCHLLVPYLEEKAQNQSDLVLVQLLRSTLAYDDVGSFHP